MVATDDTDSCNLEASFGVIKLSVLPVSMRASTECSFTFTLTTAFCKPCGLAAHTVASVG